MKLLIDLGNTRVKWCEYSGGQCTPSQACPYEPGGLVSVLDDGWSGNETPADVVLCNVAGPEIGQQLTAWMDQHWGCDIRDLRSMPELAGVRNAYPEPERLGIDRLVAMVGARSLVEGPLCVVDVGTAVTLDAVDGEGHHLGGLIAPGPGMMLTALGQTGDILMDRKGSVTEFADATPDAVASGVMLSTIALIERFVGATERKLEQNVTLVVTGGAGRRMLSHLKDARWEPDLVLYGLAVIGQGDRRGTDEETE